MRVAVGILLLCAWVTAAAAAPAMPVPFETVAEGTASGILTPTQEVVRTEAAWRALWVRHAAGLSRAQIRPEVDFSQFTVIAVFAGRAPARTRINIERIIRQDARLVVTIDVTSDPGTRMPAATEVTPFHIVRLQRLDLPVFFAADAGRQEPIDPPVEPHGP